MTLTKVHIVRAVAEQIGHTKKRSIIHYRNSFGANQKILGIR